MRYYKNRCFVDIQYRLVHNNQGIFGMIREHLTVKKFSEPIHSTGALAVNSKIILLKIAVSLMCADMTSGFSYDLEPSSL